MGAVYLAENIHAELQVALKVLNRHASKDKTLLQRFEAERKIIAKLRHPNILKLLDSFHTADGELVVVTEYVAGQTLEDVIEIKWILLCTHTGCEHADHRKPDQDVCQCTMQPD